METITMIMKKEKDNSNIKDNNKPEEYSISK
jgi:hypothetical protein